MQPSMVGRICLTNQQKLFRGPKDNWPIAAKMEDHVTIVFLSTVDVTSLWKLGIGSSNLLHSRKVLCFCVMVNQGWPIIEGLSESGLL